MQFRSEFKILQHCPKRLVTVLSLISINSLMVKNIDIKFTYIWISFSNPDYGPFFIDFGLQCCSFLLFQKLRHFFMIPKIFLQTSVQVIIFYLSNRVISFFKDVDNFFAVVYYACTYMLDSFYLSMEVGFSFLPVEDLDVQTNAYVAVFQADKRGQHGFYLPVYEENIRNGVF